MDTKNPHNKGNMTDQGKTGGAGRMDQTQKPHQQTPSQQRPQQGPAHGGRTDQTKK